MALSVRGLSPGREPLFTGASAASRRFEALVAAAALVLGVSISLRLPTPASPLDTWPAIVAAGIAGVLAIAPGGLFTVPTGYKTFQNPGSGAVFALLLSLPARQALPIAFVGMLAAQLLRRYYRHERLTWPTIGFNLAQYVVTWAVAITAFARVQADAAAWPPLARWLTAAVCAGTVYIVINTWLVAVWNALRRRATAWDLWMRTLTHLASPRWVLLGIGAMSARIATGHPVLALGPIAGMWVAYWGVSRASVARVKESVSLLGAVVEAAESRVPGFAEHSERVAWVSERLARHLGMADSDVLTVALAGKLHDVGKAALGIPIDQHLEESLEEVKHDLSVASDLVRRIPGLERAARHLWSQAERYDGTGCPDGLVGSAIPLGSRIIAVANAYDTALVRARVATERPQEHALAWVQSRSATQFDPKIVAALEALVDSRGSRTQQLAFATARADATSGRPDHPWRQDLERIQALHQRSSDTARDFPRRVMEPLPSPLHVLDRQEWERRRIAKDLHDDVGGDLTGLGYALDLLGLLPPEQVADQVRAARGMVRDLHAKIRNIALDLRPAALDDNGLLPALQRHIERYTSLTAIQVNLSGLGLDHRLPGNVETAAFRIIQEALTNIAKHARTNEATVRVWLHGRILTLSVQDGGVGFDPVEVRAVSATSGLTGMRERASLLGGSFAVTSAPDTGTRIEVHLPIRSVSH